MLRSCLRASATDGASALRGRWLAAAQLVAGNRDVLGARPGEGEAPCALVARGWASFLLALDETQLEALESRGHEAEWPEAAPPSLLELAREAQAVVAVPALDDVPAGHVRVARRLETPRKSAQIDAFARLVLPLASAATRIVDVGSGHGHLTREIAERIALPVVGLERNGELAGRARALSTAASLSFAVTDVHRDGLPLLEGDCVIGLHACGDLGDAMVESVARLARSIVLVGCCLQKQRALARRPLGAGAHPELAAALELPRSLLGLSNLTARDEGVEATRAQNLAARERRLALHRLLSADGPPLRLGAEIEGLNRRAAQGSLASLVARAFALRGRPLPTARAQEEAAVWAHVQHARVRRLSLPRAMLARVLEVLVLLDRAVHLEERGFEVVVGTPFPTTASARNLALVGRRL